VRCQSEALAHHASTLAAVRGAVNRKSELSFAPRWHVIFHDRENVVPPDDEPTFLGALRVTRGAVTGNATSKARAKNARLDARERHP
jgi:hypothetical protein